MRKPPVQCRWQASVWLLMRVWMVRAGAFILNLKFSEVYFNKPRQKVFSLELNGLKVIRGLDIYQKVGFGAAYDENIEFFVDTGATGAKELRVGAETAPYEGQLDLRFVSEVDNPKVNALLVAQGTLADFKRQQIPKRRKKQKPVDSDSELALGMLATVIAYLRVRSNNSIVLCMQPQCAWWRVYWRLGYGNSTSKSLEHGHGTRSIIEQR